MAAPAAALTEEDRLELLECARYGETEDVAVLLDAGVEVNFTDAGGNTALHRASANGHVDVVRLLADRGAKYLPNANGNYPLHWAAVNGHAAAVGALLERYGDAVDVLAKNAFGKSALTDAINAGHEDLARTILSHPSADASYQAARRAAAGGASSSSAAAAAGDADAADDGDMEETEGDVGEEDADLLEGGGAVDDAEGGGAATGAAAAGSASASASSSVVAAPAPAAPQ